MGNQWQAVEVGIALGEGGEGGVDIQRFGDDMRLAAQQAESGDAGARAAIENPCALR